MPTISKKDLVDQIAEITGVEQGTVKTVVLQFLDEITTELAQKNRRAIGHDILDFCVRELVTFGKGRERPWQP